LLSSSGRFLGFVVSVTGIFAIVFPSIKFGISTNFGANRLKS